MLESSVGMCVAVDVRCCGLILSLAAKGLPCLPFLFFAPLLIWCIPPVAAEFWAILGSVVFVTLNNGIVPVLA